VLVAHGTPCLGPITHAGCGALCPTYHRGCYGCFGPMESADPRALEPALSAAGAEKKQVVRLLSTFNANAPAFREGHTSLSKRIEEEGNG
jgi:sulfhydrogenase subunit delta